MTGFTLPGMIEEPGCVSGSASSASPARGPMPMNRMSDAIFQRPSAIVRSPPCAAIAASSAAWAWKWFDVSRTWRPVSSDRRMQARAAYSGWALIPVPDRGPAEGHREQLVTGGLGAADRLLDLARVARELLAETDRRGVLEVGAAGLDDVPELGPTSRPARCCSSMRAGISSSSIAMAPESWSAVGTVSFELWHLLTSSLGWTFAPPSRADARWLITSFMLVLVEVADPVW